MNDRAVNVLEQYDMEVTRTYKGRGVIICDTSDGLRVLKEYRGKTEKLELLDELQHNMSHIVKTDILVRNKEGGLFVKDADGVTYIVKEQLEGRECNYKSEEDVVQAFRTMSTLHLAMVRQLTPEKDYGMTFHYYVDEMEKHTRECKHVRNYLRKLKNKTDFERELLRKYDYFLEQAVRITDEAKKEDREVYEEFVNENGLFCHGDFQYHNVLISRNGVSIINLERFARESGVKDFYLLFRKISEKSEWSASLADKMLDAYQTHRPFHELEWRQLYYRLSYPDKFWKIVNFYYNYKKSWIPGRNMEKLESLVNQEKAKQRLLSSLFEF